MPAGPATTTRPAPPAGQHRAFLRQFIGNPFLIGAVAPSSPHLAREMVAGLDLAHADAVIEFGPGSGAFTDAILAAKGDACRYFAIERNPEMAKLVRQRHPGVAVHEASAADAERLCRREGIAQVDYIISGLPWASFPDDLQIAILRAALAVLKPGGRLVTFGYHIGTWLPAGRRFYKRLPEFFSSVTRGRYIWRNLPPAFVVRCTK